MTFPISPGVYDREIDAEVVINAQEYFVNYVHGDEISNILPYFGRVWVIALSGGTNYCNAIPMQIKI